ncbi:hypothetical protein EUGRSUZ_J00076 [Eucalyptus grandis]|uniref:Uncharacterized protein n=2 Tax=Eucalyptus grandis TaxID=71139 RepID=A0ACC3J0E0_EUCGR|nr:hypothetical protein EUGRSUZ_J00076 [Eucalyptus grandis]
MLQIYIFDVHVHDIFFPDSVVISGDKIKTNGHIIVNWRDLERDCHNSADLCMGFDVAKTGIGIHHLSKSQLVARTE